MIKKGKATIPLSTKCGLVDMYMACRLKSMANVICPYRAAYIIIILGDFESSWPLTIVLPDKPMMSIDMPQCVGRGNRVASSIHCVTPSRHNTFWVSS